jgi:hypothetical protein
VLGEFVEHHAREEEKTMFAMAREMFSAEERATLDEQYEDWKASPACANELAAARAKSSVKAAVKSLTG